MALASHEAPSVSAPVDRSLKVSTKFQKQPSYLAGLFRPMTKAIHQNRYRIIFAIELKLCNIAKSLTGSNYS